MVLRAKSSGGIRWSSYVGDVRCRASPSQSYAMSNCSVYSRNEKNRLCHNNGPNYGGPAGGAFDRRGGRALSTRSASQERLLVLGSGVAGCAAALTAARHGVPVTVLHAGGASVDCNSYWAQGGIIYRNYGLKEKVEDGSGEELVDTPLSLVKDIRVASGYRGPLQRTSSLEESVYTADMILNASPDPNNASGGTPNMGRVCSESGVNWNEDAAWKLALEGPSRVRQLLLGPQDGGQGHTSDGCVVPFDRAEDAAALSLCLEASHSAPRIIHNADCTGRAITDAITQAAAGHDLIEFAGNSVATDLLHEDDMVIGARVLNSERNTMENMYAVHGVVLASGGLAGIYQHSTNPLGFNALGSSVGLALSLEERLVGKKSNGGVTSDLEYVQFHPTSLYLPHEARFLLTEALRGEGAVLKDAAGRAFARDYHPAGELAPRDIVARAVFSESQKGSEDGGHNAYLDISHRDPAWLRGRFPSIHAHLGSRDRPLDFTREALPVTPAAHYTCGGVNTDLSGRVVGTAGEGGTLLYRNLYAAGEAARTGLHGGNRLASTSLLEGLVFGSAVGEVVAGVADGTSTEESRERMLEAMDKARSAVEQRLAAEERYPAGGDSSHPTDDRAAADATAALARLKSCMWDHVGVVRSPPKLAEAVADLSALLAEAESLWEREDAAAAGGWRAAALRDAARSGLAVAEAALANRTSGGAHFVVSEGEEGSVSARLASSPGDEDSEDEQLVAARA